MLHTPCDSTGHNHIDQLHDMDSLLGMAQIIEMQHRIEEMQSGRHQAGIRIRFQTENSRVLLADAMLRYHNPQDPQDPINALQRALSHS